GTQIVLSTVSCLTTGFNALWSAYAAAASNKNGAQSKASVRMLGSTSVSWALVRLALAHPRRNTRRAIRSRNSRSHHLPDHPPDWILRGPAELRRPFPDTSPAEALWSALPS